MLYPYVEFPNEINVTHSEIIKDDKILGGKKFSLILNKP